MASDHREQQAFGNHGGNSQAQMPHQLKCFTSE